MCLTPYYIDNPNYGARSPTIKRFKDTTSVKIPIPCGHCSVCLQLRQSYFVQRVQCEAMESHIFSCMLSYNDEHLPTVQINGYKHKYADPQDIQLLIKRLRNLNVFGSPFKFFAISEFGGKRHRPHWHLLFFIPKSNIPDSLPALLDFEQKAKWKVLDQWYCNLGSHRNPIKSPLLTYKEKGRKKNYDFHYVNPKLTDGFEADVAFYTSKYLTKSSDYVKRLKSALYFNLDESAYKYYWSKIKPHSLSSLGLGLGLPTDWSDRRTFSRYSPLVLDYIDKCIDFSIRNDFPFPVFINPHTGQTFPLSPYLLKHRGLSEPELLRFRELADTDYLPDTNVRAVQSLTSTEINNHETRWKRIQQKIEKRDISDYLDTESTTNEDFKNYDREITTVHPMDSDFAGYWKDFDTYCD